MFEKSLRVNIMLGEFSALGGRTHQTRDGDHDST